MTKLLLPPAGSASVCNRLHSYNSYLARVDHVFSDRHRVFATNSGNWGVEFRNQNGFPIPSLRGNWPKHRNHYLAAVDDVYAISPTTLANVRVSFDRFNDFNPITYAALTDDLNTPAALAQAEAVLDLAATGDLAAKRHALEVLFDMDQVLALSLRERASDADLSTEERTALAERDEARKKGDYKRSDELRAELERRYGIRVKDTKDGTRWERVRRKGA